LAWEAYRAGTVPVGAVIVDPGGAIASEGRNRIYDTVAPEGQLAGSRLAHAEMNALLRLPLNPDARFREYTVLTTTEPCLLCAGAITMVRVGRVRYAAADPVAGSGGVMTRGSTYTEFIGTEVSGPLPGPLGAMSRLLVEDWAWRRNPGGLVEQTTRRGEGALAALVEEFIAAEVLPQAVAAAGDVTAAMASMSSWLDRAAALLDDQ
jgi:tRNA(Arg) A34 adenosine deaminase TadA